MLFEFRQNQKYSLNSTLTNSIHQIVFFEKLEQWIRKYGIPLAIAAWYLEIEAAMTTAHCKCIGEFNMRVSVQE